MIAEPKKSKKYLPAAFLLSGLTAALFILPSMIESGVFYIGSDFVEQMVPFWSDANDAIRSGDIFWNDSLDLGTSFVGGYGYYALGSPFFWLSTLLSGKWFYKISWLFLILKYAAAGLTSFLWLRRNLKTDYAALVGSLLYTFCGFQISNQNFFLFADVVALFPLLLLALDLAMQEDRKFLFSAAVASTALCNWFLLVGVALFVLLYFVTKLWAKEYQLTSRRFFRLVAQTTLGIGIGAVLLLPNILFNLSNPRAAAGFSSLWEMLLIKPFYLADLFRGFLMPPEVGFTRGFFLNGVFNGGEMYLPLFGVVLAAAYLLKRPKSFEAKLVGISIVFMLVPALNSAFVAFNAEYYTRWFFMPALILALASAKTLEEERLSVKRGVAAYGIVWGLFLAVCVVFYFFTEIPIFNDRKIAFISMGVSLAGFLFTLFLRRIQRWKYGKSVVLAAVVTFAAFVGFFNIEIMHRCFSPDAPETLYRAGEEIVLPESEQYYRLDADGYHFYNLGAVVGYPSVDSFSSTVSGSVFDFYEMIGRTRGVIGDLPDEQYGYRAFLSAKYWARYGGETTTDIDGWKSYETTEQYHLFENDFYIPLGYTFDYAVSYEKFQLLTDEERHLGILKALILTDDQMQRHADILPEMEPVAFYNTSKEQFLSDVAERRAESCRRSVKTRDGYECAIELSRENLVFFSIPYDEGWSVAVNGEPAAIEKVNGGFMAVRCGVGENEIVFTYRPLGLKTGAILSVASVLILAGWAIGTMNRKRKKSKEK